MNLVLNFPLLDIARASEEWGHAKQLSLSKITNSMEELEFETANFYHVGQRATRQNLETLRTAVLKVARDHGFPHQGRARRDSGTAFDRAVATTIRELCPIAPAEAARTDVWNFINLRVLLDVLVWRWGAWEADAGTWSVSHDRLFQPARTAFGRLWWRVELMGGGPTATMSEDQSVQLMERTRIAGYRPLVDAITARLHEEQSDVNREDLLRVALKRLGRRMAVFSVFFMNQGELDLLVDQVFVESALALNPDRAISDAKRRESRAPQSSLAWP